MNTYLLTMSEIKRFQKHLSRKMRLPLTIEDTIFILNAESPRNMRFQGIYE